jgi:hypothetical protein|tara:strand:- start:917 stop:1129 length:213 start_codon:yes stop_codon:yes gene_type:complete
MRRCNRLLLLAEGGFGARTPPSATGPSQPDYAAQASVFAAWAKLVGAWADVIRNGVAGEALEKRTLTVEC